MPWHVAKSDTCPESKPWAVILDADDSTVACHETKEDAEAQMAALYASEEQRQEIYICECLECGEIVETEEHCVDIKCPKCGGEMRRQDRPGEGREMRRMTIIQRLADQIKSLFDKALEDEGESGRERAWDGAASRWDSTESYCAACLIDVNSAAGRTEKAQTHCMLPVKNPGSDAYDFQGIMAAAGGHGVSQVKRPDDVPAENWGKAVKSAANTIISQYKAHDETAPDSVYQAADKEPPEDRDRAIAMSRISEQIWGLLEERDGWAWPMDIYLDGADLYALVAEEGKLYRVALAVQDETVSMGDWVQVSEVHQPVGRTQVYRQADGASRWVGISATAVLNRVGEIDSKALFDSFIRQAEETGEYPRRDFFHLGEAAEIGQADLLARDGAVLVTSGTFNDTPLATAVCRAIQANAEQWGDSISYEPTSPPTMVEVAEDVSIPVYSAGTLCYISTLPEARAASLFTMNRVQEVTRMRDEVLEALRGLTEYGLTDEEIEKIVGTVDGTNRAIKEGNLIIRADEQAADESVPDSTPVERTVELDEAAITAIAGQVVESEVIVGLGEKLDKAMAEIAGLREELAQEREQGKQRSVAMDKRLRALEKDEDAKKEEWQADVPRRQKTRVTYRPRQANVKGDDEAQESLADRAAAVLAKAPKARH